MKEYKTWVDKYISNEIEHPLNDGDLRNTIYEEVERIKNQKKISSKFNPFKVSDNVYFNGLNPTNKLSEDELSLVEKVMDYHARTKYNYEEQEFEDDQSTQYAYYKELEFCEYVKMVMFVMNNLKSFELSNLSYDPASNKFIQTRTDDSNCLRVVQLFCNEDHTHIVEDEQGNVVLDKAGIVFKVAKFLCDYVFNIQFMRENIKTVATKHAMRGTAGLLVHIVNDYLIKELPSVKERLVSDEDPRQVVDFKFGWESQPEKFRNYGNVNVLEYDDDNEYFNIEPTRDVRFTERTNARYWEKLATMSEDDTLGVLTKGQIRDFYRNTLGMGRLQPKKPRDYDDVCDFLVDLFKIGANPIDWDKENQELHNPIDEIMFDSEEKWGYSREERMDVQTNTQLRKNQELQFLEYSGIDDLVGESMYEYANSRIFYWKNQDFSSHVLHPFMYNLKLWNKLNNIIINGYKDYVDTELIENMSSKVKFDELIGEFGECKNFWKYNVMDLTGYTTRYEAAIKDEHKDDDNRTTSPLTGYDGLFYPDAARDFLDIYNDGEPTSRGGDDVEKFKLEGLFFRNPYSEIDDVDVAKLNAQSKFVKAIHSIYWQLKDNKIYETSDFYLKWYSHLNYTRAEYQKIAMQLWYWRRRIWELIKNDYDISKYCLDIQGNSLILMDTFKDGADATNPYLIDLSIAQTKLMDNATGNQNTHVPFCESKLVHPKELWVKWKSNPIAMPAFDAKWQEKTGDAEFDYHYRTDGFEEMGQLTHSNNDCNDDFHVVIREWVEQYKDLLKWEGDNGEKFDDNRLPVFFDMEQSANVLALASWRCFNYKDDAGIEWRDEDGEPIKATLTGKNPFHIISIERTSTSTLEYNWTKYTDMSLPLFNLAHLNEWLFDAYHYCPANGSLLVPLYKFDCIEEKDIPEPDEGEEREKPRQIAKVDMYVIPAQMLKQDTFSAMERVYRLPIDIDLNAILDFNKENTKFRFDHPLKVCRNTNMVFSPYNANSLNKVKCAFLGVFMDRDEQPYGELNNHDIKSVGFSTCDAATRYEHDSQSELDLGLVKGGYFEGDDVRWGGFKRGVAPRNRLYVDREVAKECFNSYDSNDKYVFVLDFQTSIDNTALFMNTQDNVMSYSYNILSDAGYIPHFAYQSLVKYGDSAGVDGTAYTWHNKYLKTKNHLQFELLGLDDKGIPDAFRAMQKMVVDDTTDECKTLVNPAKLMDDIYRIWCETKTVKRRSLPGEPEDPYDSYFENEYKDYPNPRMEFVDGTLWDVCGGHPEDYFEVTLPQSNGGEPDDSTEMFKSLLDEYYVSILRTDKGQFLNEKRYILPPTKLSEFVLELCDGEKNLDDGYVDCNLGKYLSSSIEGNHYVPHQVLFVGTPNPFNYDEKGEKIYSKAETLQYGNGILGLDGIKLKIDIVSETSEEPKRDVHGNIISTEEVRKDEHGVSRIEVTTEHVQVRKKFLRPYVKFVKETRNSSDLIDRVHDETNVIEEGQFTIVLSHRNLDNIAKYHILNTSSNLYFNGSLPKTGEGQFKYSDFKFSQTVHLVEKNGVWKSKELDEFGSPLLKFKISDVIGDIPPYKVEVQNGDTKDIWYLEQDELVPSPSKDSWDESVDKWKSATTQEQKEAANRELDSKGHRLPIGSETIDDDDRILNNQPAYRENGVVYPIPTKGAFKWAHKFKSKPEKYLDYLYVNRGRLAFKVSEESQSFADAMSTIPPFYVDEATKNKLYDLNDVQILRDYSTFVHQSEEPRLLRDCSNFNPLPVDAILRYGVEQKELRNTLDLLDPQGNVVEVKELPDDDPPIVICTNEESPRLIELSNLTNKTRLDLQFEDGEVDDFLKIYTNYVKVPDGHGEFHYDFYFNLQNLFFSPFEYISTVTKQPNVLIIPDSYLYLTGDKYKDMGDHNEVDEDKVAKIKEGGELSIYGQVKVYSNDSLSDVRTIKLFTYKVYNVSDDKPKFLIEKTYDVTKATLQTKVSKQVKLEFSDVLWQIDESQFEFLRGNEDKFRVLNQDVMVVQPIHVRYNWDEKDDFRIRTISFDITNDIIDFGAVPELCEYDFQVMTLRNGIRGAGTNGREWREPYYDHWSDRNMSIEVNELTKIPRLTLTFPDGGYNFETIYLRWRLPKGFQVMDTLDRLRGYVFSSTASDVIVDCGNPMAIPDVETTVGHIVVRVKEPDTMYLGREHSTTKRLNGYVIANLASEIKAALLRGDFNPTLDTSIGDTSSVQSEWDVTFDANGGKIRQTGLPTLTKTYGNREKIGEFPALDFDYDAPDDFSDNSDFVGWFTEPEGGEKVTENTRVTENATYYAHWTRYLYYENIGGVRVAADGTTSGFSGSKYLRLVSELNLQNCTFDFVVNATTGNLLNQREQEIIGCSADNKDIEVGTRPKEDAVRFDWEFGSGHYFQGTVWIPEEYTEYYVRLLKDDENTICYAKKPDGGWVEDFRRSNLDIQFPTTKFMFGNDIDINNQWWTGTINLKKSYIIINGVKYLFSPKPSN